MELIIHIAVAMVSLALATYILVRPSRKLIIVSYVLVAGTLSTGTYLVLQGANLWHMCLTGIVYCTLAVGATELSRRRLAARASDVA